MRFLKIFWIIFFFFFGSLFLLQNKEALVVLMTLKLDLFFTNEFTSIPMPYYFIVLCSFALGAISTLGYLILSRLRIGSELRRTRKMVRVLEKELNNLRSESLEAKLISSKTANDLVEG